jgi:hypothetical protein
MRRIFSSAALPVLTFIFALTPPSAAMAQSSAAGDTAAVAPADSATGKDRSGRLRISIDESGISVEGDARLGKGQTSGDDAGGEWVEIRDDRGPYREKGVDIVKFGQSVFVAGDEMVRGDLVVFGANAIIEGRVTGNVFVIGGNIRARSGAEIKGDAMVIGGVLDEDDDVIIHGERILFDDIFPSDWGFGGLFLHRPWVRWVTIPVTLFIKLVLSFLVILFLRDRVMVGDEHLGSNFLKSFGMGILTAIVGLFALLIVMVPLIITVIGIPLALLLVVSCVGVFIIAWTMFAYSLGRLVSARLNFESTNAFMFIFVGAVILVLPDVISFVCGLLPAGPIVALGAAFKVIGILLGLFAYLSGLGAIVLSRFGSRPLTAPVAPAPVAPPVGPS